MTKTMPLTSAAARRFSQPRRLPEPERRRSWWTTSFTAAAPSGLALSQTPQIARARQVTRGSDAQGRARRGCAGGTRRGRRAGPRAELGWHRPDEAESSTGRPDLGLGADDAGSRGAPRRLRIAAATDTRRRAPVERIGTGGFAGAEWPATVSIAYQPVPSLRVTAADVPGASGCAPTRTGRIASTAAGAAASPVSAEQPIQA